MKKSWALLLALLMAKAAFAVAEAAPTEQGKIRFADLPKGDSLVITYTFSGCFTFYSAEFVYTPKDHGTFVVTELVPDPIVRRRFDRLHLGAVRLEHGEVAKLDRLLDHYREPAKTDVVRLNSSVSIQVQHRRRGRVLAEEDLTTWASSTDETMLSFGEMIAALKHASRE